MTAAMKPIKRVWKPKAPSLAKVRPEFDIYGHEIHVPDVLEKNTDSIWDTYEALQAAEALRLANIKRE
jgi:hypothetical protein